MRNKSLFQNNQLKNQLSDLIEKTQDLEIELQHKQSQQAYQEQNVQQNDNTQFLEFELEKCNEIIEEIIQELNEKEGVVQKLSDENKDLKSKSQQVLEEYNENKQIFDKEYQIWNQKSQEFELKLNDYKKNQHSFKIILDKFKNTDDIIKNSKESQEYFQNQQRQLKQKINYQQQKQEQCKQEYEELQETLQKLESQMQQTDSDLELFRYQIQNFDKLEKTATKLEQEIMYENVKQQKLKDQQKQLKQEQKRIVEFQQLADQILQPEKYKDEQQSQKINFDDITKEQLLQNVQNIQEILEKRDIVLQRQNMDIQMINQKYREQNIDLSQIDNDKGLIIKETRSLEQQMDFLSGCFDQFDQQISFQQQSRQQQIMQSEQQFQDINNNTLQSQKGNQFQEKIQNQEQQLSGDIKKKLFNTDSAKKNNLENDNSRELIIKNFESTNKKQGISDEEDEIL